MCLAKYCQYYWPVIILTICSIIAYVPKPILIREVGKDGGCWDRWCGCAVIVVHMVIYDSCLQPRAHALGVQAGKIIGGCGARRSFEAI